LWAPHLLALLPFLWGCSYYYSHVVFFSFGHMLWGMKNNGFFNFLGWIIIGFSSYLFHPRKMNMFINNSWKIFEWRTMGFQFSWMNNNWFSSHLFHPRKMNMFINNSWKNFIQSLFFMSCFFVGGFWIKWSHS